MGLPNTLIGKGCFLLKVLNHTMIKGYSNSENACETSDENAHKHKQVGIRKQHI